jgi:transposase-like protein
MAKRAKQKYYTDDFKRDAVRLMENRGKRTILQIADDLGINETPTLCATRLGIELALKVRP